MHPTAPRPRHDNDNAYEALNIWRGKEKKKECVTNSD